ncbi:unnamed protein product [Effrenium voratum]|nr:unnamed protein product [Effrenium voratum]
MSVATKWSGLFINSQKLQAKAQNWRHLAQSVAGLQGCEVINLQFYIFPMWSIGRADQAPFCQENGQKARFSVASSRSQACCTLCFVRIDETYPCLLSQAPFQSQPFLIFERDSYSSVNPGPYDKRGIWPSSYHDHRQRRFFRAYLESPTSHPG